MPIAIDRLTVEKNYPYYSTWTGKYKRVKPFRPQCPMLFIYAKKKPFMFHAQSWIDELKELGTNAMRHFDRAAVTTDRLIKEAVHELGHTLALTHCDDYECVMASSYSVEWIDVKSASLCPQCRSAAEQSARAAV